MGTPSKKHLHTLNLYFSFKDAGFTDDQSRALSYGLNDLYNAVLLEKQSNYSDEKLYEPFRESLQNIIKDSKEK
jgi:hypothetical protein